MRNTVPHILAWVALLGAMVGLAIIASKPSGPVDLKLQKLHDGDVTCYRIAGYQGISCLRGKP